MGHTAAATSSGGITPGQRREPATVLGGLPRPLRAGVLVAVIAAVGLSGLSHAGVLAPQFHNSGSGAGEGAFARGATHMGWQVLRNVSWRSWTITGVDVPDGADRDIVAFLKPPTTSTDELPDQLIATAATPALTRLPFTVPAGRELVVLEYQRRDACASPTPASPPPGATLPDSPRRLPMRTGASLSIATPLGQRRVPATLFINAPPSSASGCSATP